MCNEKKLIREIRDSISSIREEFSFKDDLRESYKNRSLTESNIFDEKIIKDLKKETAQTNQKINQIKINPSQITANRRGSHQLASTFKISANEKQNEYFFNLIEMIFNYGFLEEQINAQ